MKGWRAAGLAPAVRTAGINPAARLDLDRHPMKAAVFDRFGAPEEVLQVRDVPAPEPGRGEVRVRMLASPINPSDLLHVRGEYGRRPGLPAGAGFEGVGVIESAGPGLLRHLRRLVPG